MLVLLLIAETVQRVPTASAASVTATVRIERAVQASEDQWSKTPPARRREILRVDTNGQPILLRLIEHQ